MSTVLLPPDLKAFVQGQLASGKYQSERDLLCDAVQLMCERETRVNALRADVEIGIEELKRGECTEIESDEQLRDFFDDIESRGQRRIEREQSRQ
jgi:antitoxin ParD1/3/4